jgi:uncharacterized cupredoxin-like copper-binding protein
MRRLLVSLAALLITAPLLGACSDDSPAVDAGDDTTTTAEAAPADTGPTIEGKEFSFVVPTDLKAGTSTLSFKNTGQQIHAFNIQKVDGVHTLEEVTKAVSAEDAPPPEWLTSAGGTVLDSGKDREYTGTFEAGNYAISCPIPNQSQDADAGKPHAALGMVALFAVAPGTEGGSFPQEDTTITAKDYGWSGTDTLTAGEHTVKFVNSGPEDHELVAFKLAPGKKAKDVADFFGEDAAPGPPPFTGIPALVAPLKAGQQAVLSADIEPGDYGLFCFVGNQKGPHFAQWMIADITIK